MIIPLLMTVYRSSHLEGHRQYVYEYTRGAVFQMDNAREEDLAASFENLSGSFATPQGQAAADSVRYAYAAYMQVVAEADQMWNQGYEERQHWYFNRLQPVYLKFPIENRKIRLRRWPTKQ